MSGTAGPTERRPIVTRRSRNGRDRVCDGSRSEEHTSELQSQSNLVCRLLLEKKKKMSTQISAESAGLSGGQLQDFQRFKDNVGRSFLSTKARSAQRCSTERLALGSRCQCVAN